jgi:CBS domain-containing protein
VCVQNADKGLNMLPTVVTRYKEIKGLDAAFGIFPAGPRKTVVIARANPRAFDVGAVVRQLGGGGHAGAGSATVEAPPQAGHERIVASIRCADNHEACVRDVMSSPADTVPRAMRLADARALMARTGKEALLVVDEGGRLLGAVSASLFSKISRASQWEKPVTAMMRQHPACVRPDQSVREAMQLMTRSEIGLLPVIENDRLVGQISRATLIFDMYDF